MCHLRSLFVRLSVHSFVHSFACTFIRLIFIRLFVHCTPVFPLASGTYFPEYLHVIVVITTDTRPSLRKRPRFMLQRQAVLRSPPPATGLTHAYHTAYQADSCLSNCLSSCLSRYHPLACWKHTLPDRCHQLPAGVPRYLMGRQKVRSLVAQAHRLQPQSLHPELVDHMHKPCTPIILLTSKSLLNPKTSILIQKHHPYTGNVSRDVWGQ